MFAQSANVRVFILKNQVLTCLCQIPGSGMDFQTSVRLILKSNDLAFF